MEIVALKRTLFHYIVPVITLAAAYAITGWLGLLLAIPPVYPHSALATVGPRVGWGPNGRRSGVAGHLDRVVYGQYRDGVRCNECGDASTSAAIPTTIGVGAVVQALVGASLVHRCVVFPNTLTEARKIGALLLLGGPVSCMISATVGVTALAIGGLIPWAMYSIHWGTWWVGDTFGVLITTSLVLSWLAEPRAIWRRRWLSVVLPLVGALALVVVVFAYTHAQERERLRLLFEHQAEALAHYHTNSPRRLPGVLYSLEFLCQCSRDEQASISHGRPAILRALYGPGDAGMEPARAGCATGGVQGICAA